MAQNIRNNQPDGGEAILEAFRKLGIDQIFCSPGSEWGSIWEALTRQKAENRDGPAYVQCWHETLAMDMAIGYTSITGQTQAVLLHAGVGVLHGAMAIRASLQAGLPAIVMSGESVSLGEDPDLVVEPQWYAGVSPGGTERLIDKCVKWAGRVGSPGTLYQSVVRAGEIAQRQPKGPVYLDIPVEALIAPWARPDQLQNVAPMPKVQPPAETIARLADEIAKADAPVIVFEDPGNSPAIFHALVELADATGCGVVGTNQINTAPFPTNHPLFVGFGAFQHVADADLVLLVGGRTPWNPPSKRPTEGRIVSLSDHPIKEWLIYQNLQADEYVDGNVELTLVQLAEACRTAGMDDAAAKRREKWTPIHEAYKAGLRERVEADIAKDVLTSATAAATAAEIMPANTIYADETISSYGPIRDQLDFTMPQGYHRQVITGLGQSVGQCLGVKLASPDRPVVLFAGDGSFLYNPITQALGASKEHGLPLTIVVINNTGYQAMLKSHLFYYSKGMVEEAQLEYGFPIDNPPFETFGEPFGFTGERVDSVSGFKKALEKALAENEAGRTMIIHADVSDRIPEFSQVSGKA